jgi:hypothetical protein
MSTSDPRLLDHADDQGDEVDDEAVQDRHKTYLDASGEDAVGYFVPIALEEVGHLIVTKECPEDAKDQGAYPDFLDPGGRFPGGEEKTDEKEGDADHAGKAAGNEKLEDVVLKKEHVCSF